MLNPDIVYFSMRYARTLEKLGVFKRPVRVSANEWHNRRRTNNRGSPETNTLVSVSIDGPENLNEARKD